MHKEDMNPQQDTSVSGNHAAHAKGMAASKGKEKTFPHGFNKGYDDETVEYNSQILFKMVEEVDDPEAAKAKIMEFENAEYMGECGGRVVIANSLILYSNKEANLFDYVETALSYISKLRTTTAILQSLSEHIAYSADVREAKKAHDSAAHDASEQIATLQAEKANIQAEWEYSQAKAVILEEAMTRISSLPRPAAARSP